MSVTRWDVVSYWKDKAITKDGQINKMTEKGKIDPLSAPVMYDLGEAYCWGCNKPIGPVVEKAEASDADFARYWNNSTALHLCHILSKQFGGKGEAQNLFLLCERCHEESPDTKNDDNFFRWVYRKKNTSFLGYSFKEALEEMAGELDSRGICLQVFREMYDTVERAHGGMTIKHPYITEIASENIGAHWHSISLSSVSASIIETVMSEYSKLQVEGKYKYGNGEWVDGKQEAVLK